MEMPRLAASRSTARYATLQTMRRLLVLCALWGLGLSSVQAEAPAVPPNNRADLQAPPPRPSEASVQEQGRVLFEAIVHDDPARAAHFFFPAAAFSQVKAMQKPERYYARLRARFDQDIHALHAGTKDLALASFERLSLSRRGGWVKPGEEGNRLPYWASRHAFLHYRVGKERRKIEVRVLITWDDRWYVIHLSEFN